MRLRILDINWPLFWLVAFYRKECGHGHIAIHFYGYQKWSGPWFHCWLWERIPEDRPEMPADPMNVVPNQAGVR